MNRPRYFGIAVLGHALGIALVLQGVPHSHGMQSEPSLAVSIESVAITPDATEPEPDTTELSEFEQVAPAEVVESAAPTEFLDPEPLPEPPEVTPDPELPGHEPARQRPPVGPPLPIQPKPPAAPASSEPKPSSPTSPSPESAPSKAASGPEGEFTAPVLLEPEWPRTVRRRFTGTISVEVTVSAQGKATAARMLNGTGRDDWDEALLETFLESSYSPARRGASAVDCTHIFAVTFKRE